MSTTALPLPNDSAAQAAIGALSGQPAPTSPQNAPAVSPGAPGATQTNIQPPTTTNPPPMAPTAPTQPGQVSKGPNQNLPGPSPAGPTSGAAFDAIYAKMTTPQGKHSLAGAIIAGAITGMLRGMAAPPGPGHIAEGAQLGAQAEQEREDRNRQQKIQNYEMEQQAQVQRYQIAHLNQETSMNAAQTVNLGLDAADKTKEMNAEAVSQLADGGAIEVGADNKPVVLTQVDIMAKVKSGELSPGDSIGMQYGATEVDGKVVPLFVINKDPNAPVKVTQDMYDNWTKNGANPPAGIVGQTISAKSVTTYTNQALLHQTSDATLATLRQDLTILPTGTKDNAALLAQIPKEVDPNTPGLATALKLYQRALIGSGGDPYGAIEAIHQQNPQVAQILSEAFGGIDLLRRISNQAKIDLNTKQAAAEETARNKAALDVQNSPEAIHKAADLEYAKGRASAQAQLDAITAAQKAGNNVPLTKDFQTIKGGLSADRQVVLNQYDTGTQASLLAVAFGDGSVNFNDAFTSTYRKGQTVLTRSQALSVLKQINPQWSQQQYKVVQDAYKDATVGANGKAIQQYNNFLQHASALQDVFSNTSGIRDFSRFWNTAINKMEKAGWGTTQTKIQAAITPVTSEFSLLMSAGYKPDEEEMKAYRSLLSPNSTPAQIDAALKVMGSTGAIRLSNINQTYYRSTGHNLPGIISPDSVAAARHLNLDPASQQTLGTLNSGGTLFGNSQTHTTIQPQPGGGQTAFGPAAQVHAHMTDFTHQIPTNKGTIYSDDGIHWFDAQGNVIPSSGVTPIR